MGIFLRNRFISADEVGTLSATVGIRNTIITLCEKRGEQMKCAASAIYNINFPLKTWHRGKVMRRGWRSILWKLLNDGWCTQKEVRRVERSIAIKIQRNMPKSHVFHFIASFQTYRQCFAFNVIIAVAVDVDTCVGYSLFSLCVLCVCVGVCTYPFGINITELTK